MRPGLTLLLACFAAWASCARPPAPAAAATIDRMPSPADVLRAIARDLEALRGDFPQLADFSAEAAFDAGRLTISYQFRTHAPAKRGGWTAGVPNPDDDGVWFHIDFHDPVSSAQLHTQPVVPERWFRDQRVTLLLLEGGKTRSLAPAITEILRRHGVTDGQAG